MSLPAQLLLALLPFASSQKPGAIPAQAPGATPQAVSSKPGSSSGKFQIEFGKETQSLTAFGGTTMHVDRSPSRENGSGSKGGAKLRCEDFELTLPLLPGDGFAQWMNDSASGKPNSQALRIVEFGQDGKPLFVHALSEATIRAIELPRLEADSKQPMPGWSLSIGASRLEWQAPGGKSTALQGKHKPSLASAFRVQIDGVIVDRVTAIGPIRVESAALSQEAKRPGTMRVNPIRLRINEDDPKYWIAWLNETQADPAATRALSVELLDHSGSLVLVRLSLAGATPQRLSRLTVTPEKAANGELEVELGVGSIGFEFPGKSVP